MKTIFLIIFVAFLVPGISNVWALSSLNSLLFGEIEKDASKADPLDYVFNLDRENEFQDHSKFKEQLLQYVSVFREGENLKELCEKAQDTVYANAMDEMQAQRAVAASLQYLGLDLTTRAIAAYAKNLSMNENDFEQLAEQLVGNYCSPNVTVIGLRQLKYNLLNKFRTKNPFNLPSIKDNPYFPKLLTSTIENEKARKQEFLFTVKLFRSFCSWNGKTQDFRLLVPILNNPMIMSFIARQMGKKEIQVGQSINEASLIDSPKTKRASCDQFLCRVRKDQEFHQYFPLSLGSSGVYEDVKQMYCHTFSKLTYQNKKDQPPQIKKWIEQTSTKDHYLMGSQFIALLTGIPDLLLGQDNYKQMLLQLRRSVDETWTKWAVKTNYAYSRDLYFEESLAIEKIRRELYFNPTRPQFKVVFDVNLGELDRVNQYVDKISAGFTIKVPKSFLGWMLNEWKEKGKSDTKNTQKLIDIFKYQVDHQLKRAEKLFLIPPWKGDLAKVIATDVLGMITEYKGRFFSERTDQEMVSIPIQFRYAPFALKYINYRFRSARGQAEIKL